MNKILLVFILINCFLVLLLLQTSCIRKETTTLILEVSQVKLTREEWLKQRKTFTTVYERLHHSFPPTDSIKKNADEFTDYAYILAGAYDKGYDKKPEVINKVLATSKYMMSQRNGLLFKKLFDQKIVITDDDVQTAINKIEATKPGFTSPNKSRVKEGLMYEAEAKLYNEYVKEKLTQASYNIDSNILKQLSQRAKYGSNLVIDKQSLSDLLDKRLLIYQNNHISIQFSVSDFLDYYNTMLPIRQKMNTEEQYKAFAQQISINDLMYNDAINLGLTANSEFLAGQINFKNRTTADVFKTTDLYKNISIPENVLRQDYESHKTEFSMPEAVQVSIFTFDSMMNARYSSRGLQLIRDGAEKPLSEPMLIRGLQKSIFHSKINYASPLYDKKIINQIFYMPDQAISRPLLINNRAVIFKKEKNSGSRIKTFDEVREQIKMALIKREETKILKNYLIQAKKKYPLKSYFSDVDYQVSPTNQARLR